MAHQILYDHGIMGDEYFKTLTVLWEPHTDRISLRFQNKRESASGMVGSVREMLNYLDSRALSGHPWDSEGPRKARQKLAEIIGADAPADPLQQEETGGQALRVG